MRTMVMSTKINRCVRTPGADIQAWRGAVSCSVIADASANNFEWLVWLSLLPLAVGSGQMTAFAIGDGQPDVGLLGQRSHIVVTLLYHEVRDRLKLSWVELIDVVVLDMERLIDEFLDYIRIYQVILVVEDHSV